MNRSPVNDFLIHFAGDELRTIPRTMERRRSNSRMRRLTNQPAEMARQALKSDLGLTGLDMEAHAFATLKEAHNVKEIGRAPTSSRSQSAGRSPTGWW